MERLSGNSRWCRFRGPTSPCNGANRRPFRRLAPSKYAPANPSSYFPDSLWKANSRKFSCRILHKPSSRGAGPAPTGLHAACGGIYISWWRIKMRSPAYGRTADEGEILSLDGCWKPQDEAIGDPGRRIVLRLRFVPAPPVADRGLMRIPESLFATTTCVPCARRVKNLGSHLRGLRGRSMHDFASEFPRKTLLGTRVNEGEGMSC